MTQIAKRGIKTGATINISQGVLDAAQLKPGDLIVLYPGIHQIVVKKKEESVK